MQEWQSFLLLIVLLFIFIGFPICWICNNTRKDIKNKNMIKQVTIQS
jgi:hypothetical protein